MAPLPTKIIGFLLALICAAAALMRSGSGCGAGKGSNTFAGPTSARCVKTSQGISSDTGPRRPDSISWNARETSAGAASGYSIRSAHFTKGLLVASADDFQLCLMEGIEQAVDLRAGQAEHGIDAVRDQAADDGFAAGTQ